MGKRLDARVQAERVQYRALQPPFWLLPLARSRFREERVGVSCRFDFINGTCGGHAFAIGLGTKERRCEELTIGMSFSGASLRLRDWTFTLNGLYVLGSPTVSTSFGPPAYPP